MKSQKAGEKQGSRKVGYGGEFSVPYSWNRLPILNCESVGAPREFSVGQRHQEELWAQGSERCPMRRQTYFRKVGERFWKHKLVREKTGAENNAKASEKEKWKGEKFC